MSSIHLEILDKDRQKVFKKLRVFKQKAILGGGTALALQLNHRVSFDFDPRMFLQQLIYFKDL